MKKIQQHTISLLILTLVLFLRHTRQAFGVRCCLGIMVHWLLAIGVRGLEDNQDTGPVDWFSAGRVVCGTQEVEEYYVASAALIRVGASPEKST